MALSEEMDGQLLKLPWRSLQIGDCSFLGKVFFTESSYGLLISDLNSMWYEEADANVIEERSKELNRRLKAPISAFLAHLSQLIHPLLESNNNGPSGFSCRQTDVELILQVKSQLSGLPFYWDFHCREASVSMVFRHFLRPLKSVTHALDLQVRDLCAQLGRKDAEIQEYQESGAVLSRGRLKTDTFDETSFQESFLAEHMKELSRSSTALGFSDQLQALYRAVTAPVVQENPAPAGHSAGEDVSGHVQTLIPLTQEGSDAKQNQKPSKVPPSAAPTLTHQPPSAMSKPKKRKLKGLFT